MKRKHILIVLWVLMVIVAAMPAQAKKINGYGEMYKELPGGVKNSDANQAVIDRAQRYVAERQLMRRQRAVVFVKPVSLDIMNEKYVSIAFQAEVTPRKEAIVAILFETNEDCPIQFPNVLYLAWVGENDVAYFNSLALEGLYAAYQEMGIDDCKPGYVRTPLEKALLRKADMEHSHSGNDIVSGKIGEKLIDERIARVKDYQATIQGLEGKIAQLEKRIESLSAILNGVTRSNGTIVFNGVNVQIVNGKGSTGSTNGKGNLIVGYNESRGNGDNRDGSHNIVVGTRNDYTSSGGIVCGLNNTIAGRFSTVIGGNGNAASGDFSTITGGEKNIAKGKGTNITGLNSRTKVDEGDNQHFQKK
jgi:hypothetical protein